MKRILIVDDDMGSRESLRQTFFRLYDITVTASAASALKILESQRVDLMLLDVMMPEKDGLTLLKELQELHPDLPCIMVSASASVQPVVEAMKAGACDFVIKPFDVAEIRRIVSRTLETNALRRQVEILQGEVSREYPVNNLIGIAPSFRAALDSVQKAAETDATVLIHGESGTGKELIARRLHALSSRRNDPFVPVHCAALPETLLESELFGHEKGAFTGADSRKPGRFDLAASGTLFFDEIGEMTLSTQVKILRVIQEREYMRVGGTQVIQTNARLVAATSRNLLDEVARHTFRDDLYYRLNVIPIELPPLRERPEDISLLARHFLDAFRHSMNVKARDFDPAALDLMQQYSWPGNIRELRNIVERMSVLNGHHELIRADHLPEPFRVTTPGPAPKPRPEGQTLAATISAFERELVQEALHKTNGIQTQAARLLGTTRRILNYRMKKLGITPRMTP
ncbi:MAG: sigma-54 dependent transcriptional regulator [bacterium]